MLKYTALIVLYLITLSKYYFKLINLTTDISYKNLYGNLLKLLIDKPGKLFAETWIVVPNHSAKQWLQKSLARDLGVCAQIKFIMPLSFNWEIIKNVANQEHIRR